MKHLSFTFVILLVFSSSLFSQITANFTLNAPLGCSAPHTVRFTDQSINPDTWNWNFGDGVTSRSRNPVHTFTSSGIYDVTLTITDTNFGYVSTKKVVAAVVVDNPSAAFNASTSFGCGPLTVNFTLASAVPSSYLWNFGDGSTSTARNPSHTYNNPGNYTPSLIRTTIYGCTDSSTSSSPIIVIGPSINFGILGMPPTQPPYNFNFRDSTTSGAPITSWSWNFGDGSTSNLQNPSHTYLTNDTFDVSLTVGDLNGCSRTFTRPSYVITKLVNISLSVDSHVSCYGGSDGSITVTPSSGTAPYTYSWSNGATTATNSGLSAGTYTVTVTDAVGNFAVDLKTIVEPSLLTLTTAITSIISATGLSDGEITANASGGVTPYTYSWSTSSSTAVINGLASGNYTVTVTDSRGCSIERIQNIRPIVTPEKSPINLKVRLREVAINATPTDAAVFGALSTPEEYTIKVWARDNANLDGIDWLGGNLNLANFNPPGNTIDFNTIFYDQTFATSISPQYFDLKLEAWEDESSDNILGINCAGFRGVYETNFCCGGSLFNTCLGITESDDNYCNAEPFKEELNYRQGSPCQWYDHGYVSGSCPSNNFYEPRIESFWRYERGTAITNPIQLGTLANFDSISHFNSNECYANTYAGSTGNDVFYSFTINTSSSISLKTKNATFSNHIYLLDSVGTVLRSDTTPGTASELLSCNLSAGTYFMVVDGASPTEFGIFDIEVIQLNISSHSYASSNNCQDETNPTPAIQGLTGGIFSGNSGLSIDSVSGIIDLSASSLGTFNTFYTTTSGVCPTTTVVPIVINEVPVVSLTGASTACVSSTIPLTATFSNPGYSIEFFSPGMVPLGSGTISGTTSAIVVSLPSSTGNLTFTVTATDPSTGCSESTTHSVSIIDYEIAAFNYSSSDYCVNEVNPTPTISGTSGGIFTSSVGLAIDSASGLIDLANSISGTYAVKYTTQGICPDSSTVSVALKNPTASTVIETACDSYTWPQTGLTYTSSGMYLDTISNAVSCDSVITLNLTVNSLSVAAQVDSNITCAGALDGGLSVNITTGLAPYTYIWSDSSTLGSNTGIGAGNYSVTVSDANGCSAISSATISLLDTIKPIISTQNINVYLNSSGTVNISVADIDNGSFDACGFTSLAVSKSAFNCTEVGANTVTLVGTDVNSNIDSATAIVTVFDTINPTVLTQNLTVYLDASGQTTITTADINNGSFDNCGTITLALDSTNFDCSEVGANTVTLTATDANSNVSINTAVLTVLDTITATVITQNITVYLDASGQATITTADIDNGSFDNCGVATLALDSTNFDCSEVGANTVTLTATDANSNISTNTAVVTVLDTTTATVITQNITVYLDAAGQATITTADVDNGSFDNCSAITLVLDSTNFDCSEVGANTVTLTATDANSNVSTNTAIVTVVDSINPTVLTQNLTVYLDASGQATITTADVDNGSFDNCGTITLTLDSTNFDCSEVGANTVTLTATDANSNISTNTSIITVVDSIHPTVITQNLTVYLDASGQATINTADIDNGSFDNCGVATLALDSTNFDCSEIGANTVTLTATDANSNISTNTAVVTVLDTTAATVITQNITVYLDAAGQATITAADVDNSSFDNCSAITLALDSTNFDCSEVGTNTVTLTATDANSNVSTNTAIVTVVDSINPLIAGCPANIASSADIGSCDALITWTLPTSSDNCGIDSLVSNFNSGASFPIGTTTVTYIAYDESLNTDTCSFTITITDDEAPVFTAIPADIIVRNDTGNCGAIVSWSPPIPTDNCSIDSTISSHQPNSFFSIGTTEVQYITYDSGQNTDTVSFTVTVNDEEIPTIVCPSDIRQCDSIVTWNSPVGQDNCVGAITNRNDGFNLFSGDQFPIGITTISYEIVDVSNNAATCAFDIEVYDPPKANAGPDLITRDIEPQQIQAEVTNAGSISWSPFTGLSNATIEQPIANPQTTTIYTLEVVSPDGCVVSDEMQITVDVVTKLDATTLFTPNGDGRNDFWIVNKPALIAGCQLTIFNRNGTEVFSTNSYNNDWDGTIRGELLPEGTYYYIIDCPDNRNFNGPITILREKR